MDRFAAITDTEPLFPGAGGAADGQVQQQPAVRVRGRGPQQLRAAPGARPRLLQLAQLTQLRLRGRVLHY